VFEGLAALAFEQDRHSQLLARLVVFLAARSTIQRSKGWHVD
jgi:hypothetical protein